MADKNAKNYLIEITFGTSDIWDYDPSSKFINS